MSGFAQHSEGFLVPETLVMFSGSLHSRNKISNFALHNILSLLGIKESQKFAFISSEGDVLSVTVGRYPWCTVKWTLAE